MNRRFLQIGSDLGIDLKASQEKNQRQPTKSAIQVPSLPTLIVEKPLRSEKWLPPTKSPGIRLSRQTKMVLQRFQWGGIVLTTDSTDGHRSDAFYVWFRSHLCPSMESVVKTGFLSILPSLNPPMMSRGEILTPTGFVKEPLKRGTNISIPEPQTPLL